MTLATLNTLAEFHDKEAKKNLETVIHLEDSDEHRDMLQRCRSQHLFHADAARDLKTLLSAFRECATAISTFKQLL